MGRMKDGQPIFGYMRKKLSPGRPSLIWSLRQITVVVSPMIWIFAFLMSTQAKSSTMSSSCQKSGDPQIPSTNTQPMRRTLSRLRTRRYCLLLSTSSERSRTISRKMISLRPTASILMLRSTLSPCQKSHFQTSQTIDSLELLDAVLLLHFIWCKQHRNKILEKIVEALSPRRSSTWQLWSINCLAETYLMIISGHSRSMTCMTVRSWGCVGFSCDINVNALLAYDSHVRCLLMSYVIFKAAWVDSGEKYLRCS